MPSKLSSIQLWDAGRTGAITLPETFKKVMSKQPHVVKELGKPYSMDFALRSSSQLATAVSSDDYYLSKKKIIRLVYDDSTFEEWRIKRASREFSGEQDFRVECEPIWQDLAYANVRQTLSTGVVRSQVNFYGSTVDEILTVLFGSSYNAPSLFQKGTIDSTIGAKEPRMSFNGSTFMEVLFTISQKAEAEWDVTWNSGDSKYDINFYQIGDLGGGSGQATDRPIKMGGGDGNRKNLLRQDSEEDYFSRIEPIAGQGTDTVGIGGIEARGTVSVSGATSTIDLDQDLIPYDDMLNSYSETLYYGNAVDGWKAVTDSIAPNQIKVTGSFGAVSTVVDGTFALGASKKQLVYLESPSAVSDIGVVEKSYRRTDIPAYTNIIKRDGISDNFSVFSSGVPVGTSKVGTPTVTEETSDQFVKFGSKSAKIVADTGEGLSWDVEISGDYPYYSLLTYMYVAAGSVKMEFEDADGNLVPEGEFAETSEAITQALSMEGAKPVSGTATIRVVALEDSTTFYLDACVLTNSATAVPYAPLMGVYDLWLESARQLNLYGGIQPNEYVGSCMDDSYFNGSLREIEIGSWVNVLDGYNGSSHDIDFEGRVLRVEYIDEFAHGRVDKIVQISNRSTDLEQFLNSNYLTQAQSQDNNNVKEVASVTAIIKAIQDGNLIISADGDIQLIGDGALLVSTEDQYLKINVDGFDYRNRSVETDTAPPFDKVTIYTQMLISSNAIVFNTATETGVTNNIEGASYSYFGNIMANTAPFSSRPVPIDVDSMIIKFNDKTLRLSNTKLSAFNGSTLASDIVTF